MDRAAVERAAAGLKLQLTRLRHPARTGEVLASSVGASLELHDFRAYQPGDDVRQIDWNVVARTDELFVRVRQNEVTPVVELVLDGSRSMAVSAQKSARAKELALLVCAVAGRQRLQPRLVATAQAPVVAGEERCEEALERLAFDARDDLLSGVSRVPPLRRCGVRVVVSDFLFELPDERALGRFAQGAQALALVQLLDESELAPEVAEAARLIDVETDEALERTLDATAVNQYAQRLSAHRRLVERAARLSGAQLLAGTTRQSISAWARGPLRPLWGGAR